MKSRNETDNLSGTLVQSNLKDGFRQDLTWGEAENERRTACRTEGGKPGECKEQLPCFELILGEEPVQKQSTRDK